MDFVDIQKLSALLKKSDSDSSDNDMEVRPGPSTFHPGVIGSDIAPCSKNKKLDLNPKSNGVEAVKNSKESNKSIWTSGELPGGDGRNGQLQIPDLSNDPRQRPEVTIQYKQNLAPEDIFLNTGYKSPGSASCDWIVVKITMSGETDHKTFRLDLKDDWIELRTKLYVLVHVLPHRINPRLGDAKWDKVSSILTLNLKIVRDFDVFNGV